MMQLRVLGPVELARDDREVELGPSKPKALLAALAVRANHVVSVDRLIDDVWGEEAPKTARATLRTYIAQLRKVLGPGVILTQAEGYVLHISQGQLDSATFESLLARGRNAADHGDAEKAAEVFRRALDLWRGRAFGDLADEPFASAESNRLEELRLSALEERIEADLASGRHAHLVGELEELTSSHPFRERFRDQLMHALYRAGRQVDALSAYHDYRKFLDEELGIDPSPALRQLEARILRHDPSLARVEQRLVPAGAAGSVHASERSLPDCKLPVPFAAAPRSSFIGRTQELEELVHVWEASDADKDSRVVLVSGEPGVGKTRFACEAARAIHSRGGVVLLGRCTRETVTPYQPVVEMLRQCVEWLGAEWMQSTLRQELPHLGRLLPELDLPAPDDRSGDRYELFESVRRVLTLASTNATALFVFDDLHWADAPTLLLLRHIAGTLTGDRFLILGAYRGTDVTHGGLLWEWIGDLRHQSPPKEITLDGLDRDDVGTLITHLTGTMPLESFVEEVHERTDGNPFFVEEILRHLAETGRSGAIPLHNLVPPAVRDVIARRLQRLTGDARNLLLPAAVSGREFELDVIARVLNETPEGLLDAVDEAAAAGLVVETGDSGGYLAFSHVLIRDALYEDLSAARRAHLHGRLGEILEEMYGDDARRFSELAHHFSEAGPSAAAKAAKYSQHAGQLAMTVLAFEEAAEHFRRALEASNGAEDGARCRALIELGEAEMKANHVRAARRSLLRAGTLAKRLRHPEDLARAALASVGPAIPEPTDPALIALLEDAIEQLDDDSLLRARLLGALASKLPDGSMTRIRLIDEGLAAASRLDDPLARAWALYARYWGLWDEPPAVRIDLCDELSGIVRRLGLSDFALTSHQCKWMALMEAGDITAADAEFDSLRRGAETSRLTHYVGAAQLMRCTRLLLEGRLRDAETLLLNPSASSVLAGLPQLRREQDRALEVLPMMRAFFESNPQVQGTALLAALALEGGEDEEGRRAYEDVVADGMAGIPPLQVPWRLSELTSAAEACARLQDADRARGLYSMLLPYSPRACMMSAAAYLGSVDRQLGLLATLIREWDTAAHHFELAERFDRRAGAWPMVARVQIDHAAMLLERNDRGDGARSEALLASARKTALALDLPAVQCELGRLGARG